MKFRLAYHVSATVAIAASLLHGHACAGVLLGERVGINFNNRYADPDTKTDWLSLSIDQNDASVTQTINDLSMTVSGGYRNYRLGFSRSMASNPADLGQWIDTLEEVIAGGNQVMVAGWFQGDISDAEGDAVHWKTVVDAIDARGLTPGISGWELQNEPAASNAAWRDYVRQLWKRVGPHGDVGWQNLTQLQRDATAGAWNNKPIVVQGTTFGQRFNATLVDGLADLNDLVWSVHDYSKFSEITADRETWTVQQWQSHFLDKWADRQSLLNDNFVVTELGTNDSFDHTLTGMGPAGTTADSRRDAGFVRAAEERYGESTDTTVFWYTAYNPASIGVGNTWQTTWRKENHHATNFVFSSQELYPGGAAGTANVALGKPVVVDSTSGSYVGSNAVDGNKFDTESRWLSSNSPGDHWIEVDLQDEFLISGLRFWMGYDQYEEAISDFVFERFHDGAWETIFAESGNNNPIYAATFDPVVADRVRLYSTAGLDERVRLFEIEVYGVLAPSGLAGDYNGDGVVDATDYAVWRENFGGEAGTLANDVDGGRIGLNQYNTWLASFGRTEGADAASFPTPEPSACLMGMMALFLQITRKPSIG